jgi:raffinose/stachyose/melibiose transport system substrate-binding protein
MKKHVWKKIVAPMLAGAMLLSTAACSGATTASSTGAASTTGNAKGGYNISFMIGQSTYKEAAFTKIKEKMLKEKNITLNFEVVPDSQGTNLLQTKLATGEVPDVVWLNIPESYTMYDATKNFVALDDQPWVKRMTLKPSDIQHTDGKIYGMPVTGFSGVMGAIYNKTVFKELGLQVPKTYAEFLKVLDTVKNSGKNITPLYISGKDSWTVQIAPMIFMANALDSKADSTYKDLLNNKTKFSTIPEFTTGLKAFQDLFTKGYTNKDFAVATYDNSKQAVATGKAAMLISGEYAVTIQICVWLIRS